MLPAVLRKKLNNQERPTARERREMICIISGEILAICKKPSKKHLNEIARKMVLENSKSLKDVIEDEIVGSGHDSLTKQLQCRVDNYKRNKMLNKHNSTPTEDTSTVPENKKKRKDSYGCIVLESVPVNMDAQIKGKKKVMQEMFMTNDRNEKRIQELISDTFISQRRDIRSVDTQVLEEE